MRPSAIKRHGRTNPHRSKLLAFMKNIYSDLLIELCDGLISVQDKSADKAFRGGIYCRACKNIHGRCPDAVFGFIVAAKITGDSKYLDAAKSVFDYGDNLMCRDGGLYNDAQTTWRYTTTFHEIAVIEALHAGKDLLDAATKGKFETRAYRMAEWLYENLNETSPANINYATTNGLALALAGKYFSKKEWLDRAKRLAYYAADHFTENHLLFGESKPHNRKSDKGCVAVDIGYNVEESVPALVKYAYETGDTALFNRLEKVVKAHLAFMLPDGGWDNTFGNRNNKWTYWGSRTSDGCAPMFLLYADRDPAFAEAAKRNTQMLQRCTIDGFLYGGVQYHLHGEHACTHHAFEHINSLAFAIENVDEKYLLPESAEIPSDAADVFAYYPEVRTYKIAKGDYSATITDYDFDLSFSGHASGVTLTSLFRKGKGSLIAASVTDYVLVEPTNMQQVLDRDRHRPLVPRFELIKEGVRYASSFFRKGEISAEKHEDCYVIMGKTGLSDNPGEKYLSNVIELSYTLSDSGIVLKASGAEGVKYVLPLVSGNVEVKTGSIEKEDEIFFLTGGFIAKEYTIQPKDGCIEIKIY